MRWIALICAFSLAIASWVWAGGGTAPSGRQDPGSANSVELVRAKQGAFSGAEQHDIQVGSLKRTYYLYTPAGIAANAPLIIAFHGGGQTPERFTTRKGLFDMADRYGFVLAIPEAINENWNANSIEVKGSSQVNNIDDLGFAAALLDDVLATGRINASRVYLMGVSKGGMMSYDVACNMPGRIAALGVVAATLSSGKCASPEGVSLLHIHGTQDERVPFEGGHGAQSTGKAQWASAIDGINLFASESSCSADWISTQITADTTCRATACPGSDEVQYCLVEGGGHTWPGVATTKRQKKQGAASSTSFNATDYIAQFFLRH